MEEPIKGNKDDQEKECHHLFVTSFLIEFAKVLTHGKHKYGQDNWRHVKEPKDRYYSALIRHLYAYKQGSIIDDESKLNHLAHAACNCMFLFWFQIKDKKDES